MATLIKMGDQSTRIEVFRGDEIAPGCWGNFSIVDKDYYAEIRVTGPNYDLVQKIHIMTHDRNIAYSYAFRQASKMHKEGSQHVISRPVRS